MTDERWNQLMRSDPPQFTPREILDGFHECPDWDGLIIGQGFEEMRNCRCFGHYAISGSDIGSVGNRLQEAIVTHRNLPTMESYGDLCAAWRAYGFVMAHFP